jgi:protein associated with RNAse G/E
MNTICLFYSSALEEAYLNSTSKYIVRSTKLRSVAVRTKKTFHGSLIFYPMNQRFAIISVLEPNKMAFYLR